MVKVFKKTQDVDELENAIINEKIYLNDEFKNVLGFIRKLQNTEIPRSDLLEFEMTLNKLRKEHHRIEIILDELKEIDDEEVFAEKVKTLKKQRFISEEISNKLLEADTLLELEDIAQILRNDKIGDGLYLSPYILSEINYI